MLESLKAAFRYPLVDRSGWRTLGRVGIWLLLCPPVGWILALGYRAEAAWKLWNSPSLALPPWPGLRIGFFTGLKAAAIISAYLSPVVALFWIFGLDSWENAQAHGMQVAALTVLIPLSLPVTVPLIGFGAPMRFEWLHFSELEAGILFGSFALVLFCLPAAFLQVSVTRQFRRALSVPKTLGLIAAAPRLYCGAWGISLAATGVALCTGPFLPWAIVWSYLVIGFAFNHALARMNYGPLQKGGQEQGFLKRVQQEHRAGL